MKNDKRCFLNQERPCDLTCKAAVEVDDPIDNVDCQFVWLAFHFGEGLFELKNMMQGGGGSSPGASPFPPGFGAAGTGPIDGPDSGKGPQNN